MFYSLDTLKEIKNEMKPAMEELKVTDRKITEELYQELSITSYNFNPETMSATEARRVCHFFGYLVHTVRKKINCEYCAEIFVNQNNACDDTGIEEETCLPNVMVTTNS